MALFCGLLVGIAFGFVLKKSRICYTGTIRDIYLEGRNYNLLLLLATIFTEAVVYNIFVIAGYVTDGYMTSFSLVALPVGSMLFGFGAVMSSGCLTMSIVKSGDGRIIGWISLATFMIVGCFFSAGGGRFFAGKFIQTYEVFDKELIEDARIRLGISVVVTILIYVAMWRKAKKKKKKSHNLNLRNKDVWFILSGIVLGIAFPVSEHFGRIGGVAIVSPLLSYPFTIMKPAQIVGGCNIYDQHFGLGSTLVFGILLGSFLTSVLSKEFHVVIPSMGQIVKTIIGSAMMAFGALVAGGCLVGNGLVKTAQFSAKAWVSLIFIALGIWIASYILLRDRSDR
ncbi:YeeE/YedE family protein [Mogibacterium sp.]